MVYEKTFRKTGFRDAGNWRGAAGDQFDSDYTVGEIL